MYTKRLRHIFTRPVTRISYMKATEHRARPDMEEYLRYVAGELFWNASSVMDLDGDSLEVPTERYQTWLFDSLMTAYNYGLANDADGMQSLRQTIDFPILSLTGLDKWLAEGEYNYDEQYLVNMQNISYEALDKFYEFGGADKND